MNGTPPSRKKKKRHSKSSHQQVESADTQPRPHKHRTKPKYEVTAPTGDKIRISNGDIINPMSNSELVKSMSNMDLMGVYPSKPILNPIQPDTQVLFVPVGNKYKPIDPLMHQETIVQTNPELGMVNPDELALAFINNYQSISDAFFRIIEALFVGSCVLTMIITPGITSRFSESPVVPNATKTTPIELIPPSGYAHATVSLDDVNTFSFIGYYSSKAMLVSIIFQILSIFNLFHRIQVFVNGYDLLRSTSNIKNLKRNWIFSIFALACSILSFAAIVLLIHIDFNLFLSQTEHKYGGYFGLPNWFFSQAAIESAETQLYLKQWQVYNTMRNLCGIIGFVFGFVSDTNFKIEELKVSPV